MENTQEKHYNLISAEIIADSLNQFGERVTTFKLVFPRIILAEFNTHRMFNRNSASSRAIPFEKMVKMVKEQPFIPIAWQKDHKGMQGTEYHIDNDVILNDNQWLEARDNAIFIAKNLHKAGVTKQLCNRLLEPFMWTTMLITGSKEGWDNFFELRCPSYQLGENFYKSKKDWKKSLEQSLNIENSDDKTPLFWLRMNKGQAEIHMMALAESIYDCIQESVPTQLKNEWHIPFEDKINELYPNLTLEDKIKVSVGMAANTSYTIVGDGSIITLEKATRIHDKCKELSHSSVFEHCARAMSEVEYTASKSTGYTRKGKDQYGWCRNFKGFIPYRHIIETQNE